MFFPYYSEEIISLQYKTIENINENIIFEGNSRKRKRFHLFIDSLIEKNNEFIEKIRRQDEEDNNINNYEKVDNKYDTEEYSDYSHKEYNEDEEDVEDEEEDVEDEEEEHEDIDKSHDDDDINFNHQSSSEETIYENGDKKNN